MTEKYFYVIKNISKARSPLKSKLQEVSLDLNKEFIRGISRPLCAKLNKAGFELAFFYGLTMDNLKIYEIQNSYIDYLVPFAPHLFHNRKENQENERKYIGIILTVNGLDYFAPLSSFKEKHKKMKNNMDFLKVGNYAVINLNNMFPVPESQCNYVDISKESNPSYRALLSAEYRIITSLTDR